MNFKKQLDEYSSSRGHIKVATTETAVNVENTLLKNDFQFIHVYQTVEKSSISFIFIVIDVTFK